MAGVFATITGLEFTAATSGGWKSALRITAAANHRVNVQSWGGYARGQNNADKPILFRLIRGSSAGSGGGAATIEKTVSGQDEAVQTTAACGIFSTEPSPTGGPLDQKPVHPQAGLELPAYERGEKQIAGSEIVLIQYFNDGGAAVPIYADCKIEE